MTERQRGFLCQFFCSRESSKLMTTEAENEREIDKNQDAVQRTV